MFRSDENVGCPADTGSTDRPTIGVGPGERVHDAQARTQTRSWTGLRMTVERSPLLDVWLRTAARLTASRRSILTALVDATIGVVAGARPAHHCLRGSVFPDGYVVVSKARVGLLRDYPLIHTSSVDEAEQLQSQLTSPVRATPATRRDSFEWRASRIAVGDLGVVASAYRGGVRAMGSMGSKAYALMCRSAAAGPS